MSTWIAVALLLFSTSLVSKDLHGADLRAFTSEAMHDGRDGQFVRSPHCGNEERGLRKMRWKEMCAGQYAPLAGATNALSGDQA